MKTIDNDALVTATGGLAYLPSTGPTFPQPTVPTLPRPFPSPQVPSPMPRPLPWPAPDRLPNVSSGVRSA